MHSAYELSNPLQLIDALIFNYVLVPRRKMFMNRNQLIYNDKYNNTRP